MSKNAYATNMSYVTILDFRKKNANNIWSTAIDVTEKCLGTS